MTPAAPTPGPDQAGVDPPAAAAIQGGNPFVGLTAAQVAAATARWAGHLARRPTVLASHVAGLGAEELRILAGASTTTVDPKDRRFTDPAWSNPLWKRVAQSYLATRDTVLSSIEDVGLDPKSADRARFALMQLTEAAAPTNTLAGNPAAIKKAARTRGRSLVDGSRHLMHDVLRNGGMPSQVDTRPFVVGQTIATTPGSVVYRTEVFELIQYRAATAKVRARPMLVIPPQVNRYYFLDLAPGRSFIEYGVSRGLQMFTISWRNPTPAQRDWSLETYAAACIEAVEVVNEITGSDDCNVIGFCAGGITQSVALSHLAATGRSIVHASARAVTTVDTTAKSTINMFASKRSVDAAVRRSGRRGVLTGRSMARVFAWVRPNDLVWNYVVSNYLMGENPPAFDVLAWNADTTNLPAALHAQFVHLFSDNALMTPGAVTVLGTPVDLSNVKTDLYVVGASTDHLVPWEAAYRATQAYGGESRFVLSNSGHIQALVNPPSNPKASFLTSDDNPPDPHAWRAGARQVKGSWWVDWADWAIERSGEEKPRPRRLGSRAHGVLAPAPGRYVHES
jgi:polyhydroxyalkanoate synthase